MNERFKELPEEKQRAVLNAAMEVSDDLKVANAQTIDGSFAVYFENIDFGKFKEDTDPEKILRMIVWLMDGYLHEQQMKGKTLDLDEIETELDVWIKMFKGISYKEEFL